MPKAIQPAGDRAASKARPAGSESACSPRARGWLAGVGAGGVLAESPGIGGRREGGEGRGFWRIPHGPLLPYTHRQERTCSGSPAPGPTPPPPPTDKKPPQPHRQTSPQMGTAVIPALDSCPQQLSAPQHHLGTNSVPLTGGCSVHGSQRGQSGCGWGGLGLGGIGALPCVWDWGGVGLGGALGLRLQLCGLEVGGVCGRRGAGGKACSRINTVLPELSETTGLKNRML